MSYFSNRSRNALWIARLLPLAGAVFLAAALAVHNQATHGFLVGAALGLLVGYSVFSFQMESVTMKDTAQPSDATPHRITE